MATEASTDRGEPAESGARLLLAGALVILSVLSVVPLVSAGLFTLL